jgi:hypothetical protein
VVATGQTVVRGDRVKLSASANPPTIAVSGAGEGCIGVALRAGSAGATVAVKLITDSGTFKVRAAGAVTALAYLYGAAAGEVDDTVTGSAQFQALEAASNVDEYIEAIAVNLPSTGESGTGVDFVLYGDTTGAEVTFDVSADTMLFDGIDLYMRDSDILAFGDATAGDVTMTWNGTNFTIAQAAASSAILVGASGAGFDVTVYGDTTGANMVWDQSEDTLELQGTANLQIEDSGSLQFGDSDDIVMSWNASNFAITQAGTSSAIFVGTSGAGMDLTLYGDTTGADFTWDQSANELKLGKGANIDLTATTLMIDFAAGVTPTYDTTPNGFISVNLAGSPVTIPYWTT